MGKKEKSQTRTKQSQFALTDEQVKEILLRENYVSDSDIFLAQKYAEKNRSSILDYLISQELITGDLFGQAVSEALGMAYADLNSHVPQISQIVKIPEDVAKEYRAVLFFENKVEVVISTDNPLNNNLASRMKDLFPSKKVSVAYSLTEDIDKILVLYRKPLDTRFAKIIQQQDKVAPEIIEEIIDDAIVLRSSDVHFEPRENEVLVRFRVDGVLRDAGRIPMKYYENIVNRIKVQSYLRIDDHFSAQDGSMRIVSDNKEVDLRVSVVPTLNGEKIVLRVLAEYVRRFTLGDLGFTDENLENIRRASRKPFGMILVTGPTGSGKTTTLYALLKELNKPDVNITTIEDPVEYQIAGVNQIQVNVHTNLTFSKGLRSIVRQDPDVILVGEIRDQDTAEIAVNAALTGHLLFSTFHANDAATSIPRLLDMGIEPFLLASTLELVVAQRLVRRICDKCRFSTSVSQNEIKKKFPGVERFFNKSSVTLYQGKGCDYCKNTGFHGRTAIFELIEVTNNMQDLVLKNPSTNQIWKLARKQGSRTLFEDGIEKVKSGVTTIEELSRVAAVPEVQILS